MTVAQWFLLLGALLLAMGLSAPLLRRLPFTPAIVYLAVGLLFGPTALNLFHFNPLQEAALLEVLTEVALLISLFSAGVKMPVPFTLARWRVPMLMATVSMAITVAAVAVFAHWVLGLPIGAGILLGAIVAPTDPVLATDVQSRHAGDRDQLRFNLTCEAGMNDGSAFPFVVLGLGLLGLHDIGDFGLRWLLVDVLWATAAAIVIGVAAGAGLARLCARLRQASPAHRLMDDFLGLGLIGVVYGAAVLVHAWGFLAVFFAALALRQTELQATSAAPRPQPLSPSPAALQAAPAAQPEPERLVSIGSLVFKEHLERLSEVVLVLLVGGALFVSSWRWEAVALALFLFVVARPLSVFAALTGSHTPLRMRAMMAWFGVRGIGSLYYLMYAIGHGLPEPLALEMVQMTLIVVTLSILLHGTSVKPLMDRFWRPA